jgi:hypothetical protein
MDVRQNHQKAFVVELALLARFPREAFENDFEFLLRHELRQSSANSENLPQAIFGNRSIAAHSVFKEIFHVGEVVVVARKLLKCSGNDAAFVIVEEVQGIVGGRDMLDWNSQRRFLKFRLEESFVDHLCETLEGHKASLASTSETEIRTLETTANYR